VDVAVPEDHVLAFASEIASLRSVWLNSSFAGASRSRKFPRR